MAVPALFPAVQLRPPLLTEPASSHPEEQSTAQHCLTAGNLCSSIKIKKIFFFFKDNQGTFLFFGGRRRIENVEKKNAGVGWDGKRGLKAQPSGTPQRAAILHSWFTPPFQSTRASRSAQAAWACREQLGLRLPQVTQLQFEVAAMGLSSSRSMLELVGCRLL